MTWLYSASSPCRPCPSWSPANFFWPHHSGQVRQQNLTNWQLEKFQDQGCPIFKIWPKKKGGKVLRRTAARFFWWKSNTKELRRRWGCRHSSRVVREPKARLHPLSRWRSNFGLRRHHHCRCHRSTRPRSRHPASSRACRWSGCPHAFP